MSLIWVKMIFMEPIIRAIDLTKKFPVHMGIFGTRSGSFIHAVDHINFSINKGETFGIVGESGCGKTTVAKLILRLLDPTTGTIYFQGKDITHRKFPISKMRRSVQLIFQDPYSSLNPRMTVYDIIGEPLDIHRLFKGQAKTDRILQLMETVGLRSFHLYRYPHEFSGGQRQRVVIARALAVQPDVLIMDEPVSALDVSVRAQVLNLLDELQKEMDLTYVFISHDLSVVRYVCDRCAIMYLGQIVEMGEVNDLFDNPQHPYSEALLAAVPIPDPKSRKQREILSGEVPTPIDPPPCCRFAKRCKYAKEICLEKDPPLLKISDDHQPDRQVVCYYPQKLRGTDKVPFTEEKRLH